MNALRLIRNQRAVLKLSAKPSAVPREPGPWPNNLPPPVHVKETRNKELAVSALCSLIMRDGERLHSADLTAEQAADIAKWLLLRPAV